ncbi:hypothetical protein LXL04_030356 [Taraxacum kok-saghyz]
MENMVKLVTFKFLIFATLLMTGGVVSLKSKLAAQESSPTPSFSTPLNIEGKSCVPKSCYRDPPGVDVCPPPACTTVAECKAYCGPHNPTCWPMSRVCCCWPWSTSDNK